jgi:TIR domain
MLLILYQDSCDAIATNAASDIATAFAGHVEVQALAAGAPTAWPGDVSWDDLLVIVYNADGFPAAGNDFIEEFVRRRPDTALLLPVAADPAFRTPPGAAAKIKALEYDADAPGVEGRLVNRIGGMLGLRLQGRDAKIFISYRATDGASIANQLHAYLTSSGHRAYLDEAQEIDGETAILPGSDVQLEIDKALADANLVLLLDTPGTPASRWIKHEVDTADGLLLPILPICFRNAGDPRHGPRFSSLLALQRWVELPTPSPAVTPPLTDDQLSKIVGDAEKYLCEIFIRKCRVPFIVEKQFVSRGFAWKVLDKRLLIFESLKVHGARLQTKVCSHCSMFEQVYMPALTRFCAFLKETGRANYSLFIYDGDLLPPGQLEDLAGGQDENVIILHHQELAALIDSNFTMLGAA